MMLSDEVKREWGHVRDMTVRALDLAAGVQCRLVSDKPKPSTPICWRVMQMDWNLDIPVSRGMPLGF
jgi:hypothetical protein